MQIAVLGGGNGSYAAAADLSEQGHDIRLWRRDGAALGLLLATKSLRLRDAEGTREVLIACVTADIGEAVRGAELIVIPTPAFSQHSIAQLIGPHLSDGQVIFLPPGTFGSFAMMQELRVSGCTAEIIFAETGTLPYLTRKHGPTEVAITVRAVRLPTGFFPARHSERGMSVLSKAFPSVHLIEDALSAALMNGGPIIHPALDAFVITPICPHMLTNRPLVVPDTARVELDFVEVGEQGFLTLDGQIGFQLEPKDRVVITKSASKVQFVNPPRLTYYEILRSKLRWGER